MNLLTHMKQREALLAAMVVALVLLVGLRAPVFLSAQSLANLLTDSTLLVMLALTQMLVIVTRGIDLSVASNLALSGMVAAMLKDDVQDTDLKGGKYTLPYAPVVLPAINDNCRHGNGRCAAASPAWTCFPGRTRNAIRPNRAATGISDQNAARQAPN